MNKIAKHTIQSQFALLLFAVFISSLLIKPIHILLVHHELSGKVCATEHGQVVTIDHYEDCPICDFEFCTFIPQQKTSIPQAICIVFKQQTPHTVTCLIRQSSHLFQLRAPPVC
jgi:hypothetical protein